VPACKPLSVELNCFVLGGFQIIKAQSGPNLARGPADGGGMNERNLAAEFRPRPGPNGICVPTINWCGSMDNIRAFMRANPPRRPMAIKAPSVAQRRRSQWPAGRPARAR
jgi:hypothetical protein